MNEIRKNPNKIPSLSLSLLESVKGRVITKFIKHVEWELEDYLKTFYLDRNKVFEYGYGTLYVELDREMIIGLSCIPKKISVSVFFAEGELIKEKRNSSNWIDCADKIYSRTCWGNVVGKRVESIEIIKFNNSNCIASDGLNERGILFGLNSGNFIFSHALAEAGPMDTVVMELNQLRPEIVNAMNLVEV